jgi:MFS family permease
MTLSTNLASPRAAIMAVFAAFGAIVGVFSGSVPQMMAGANLTNTSYGLAITLMTATTVASMGIAGALAARYSHRRLLLVVLPLAWAAYAGMLTSTSPQDFFILAALSGVIMGILDVIMNAEGGAIEIDLKRPVYTTFHGSVSLSLACFAIISSVLSTEIGTWASICTASIAVIIAMILVYKFLPPRTLPIKNPDNDDTRHFTKPLILIGIAAGLIIACEICALFWSSKLLADTAPQLAAISGIGAAFFGLCNASLRFFGDRLRARFDEKKLMISTLSLAILGFGGLGLTSGFAANVFFFALTGLGVSLLCPCLYAMSSRETPKNRAAGLSASMLVAGVPRIIAPTAFGTMAQNYSTSAAFGACALVLLVAMLVILNLDTHVKLHKILQ